ncbi:6-phosphofructo-2-kinase Ecym_2027 [Eremothecium cymbalariae DBVPG|uniref:6-phosphofructo-2-kinase domain-containing protein n=1 Tax=Eremothecium cymbalariae (strain CBS 270.75 / DBVPG 7215 / KCTC 17166 / NRRL Y-17582) TaxID=931890 RepID=G8JNY6_ERECY|nr:Hypothetical protein Ecym_2027 [Eremothecium cymbalariae DBVPG\
MEKEFSDALNALRSHSTSANSLFSLKDERSFSSVLECCEESNHVTLQRHSTVEKKGESEGHDGRDQQATEDGSLHDQDEVLGLEYETKDSPLTLNYKRRNGLTHGLEKSQPLLPRLEKFIIVLIGLPATGKSTISAHLIRFLQNHPVLLHLRCSVYNAGQVRRKLTCTDRPMLLSTNPVDDLFNPKNSDKKNAYARITLEALLKDLDQDLCDLAIFDATNSTVIRRTLIFQYLNNYNKESKNKFRITPIVLQVKCTNENFIRFNIHNKTFNQDYFDKPYEFSVRDFAKRLMHYQSQFVPFDKQEFYNILASYPDVELSGSKSDGRLFFFNILNAGLDTPFEPPLLHYPQNLSPLVVQVVEAVESFVQRYSQMYGFKYIESANMFIKGDNSSTTSTATGEAKPPSNRSYLPTLCSIINEQYFHLLNHMKK